MDAMPSDLEHRYRFSNNNSEVGLDDYRRVCGCVVVGLMTSILRG